MKIAVVIPTYNEIENISKLLPEILNFNISGLEVVVVDDNSPDGTGKIVEEMKTKDERIHAIHRLEKRGLGTAYIEGFKYALEKNAEYIIEMDADFSHDPKMIPIFLDRIKHCDLVVGSRYKNGTRVINWPLQRLILSYLANIYVRLVTGMRIADSTSGFKCFKRKVLDSIDLEKIHSNGYSFQIEMNYRTYKKNFLISEIPIIFTDRYFGTSKMSRNIILEALLIVWKLRFGMLK
jgi:dolichol-phosphate mannosyltransferase